MPESQPLQKHSVYDLNAMMYAMPGHGGSLPDQTCYVHRMPNEVLSEIFEWLLYMPGFRISDKQPNPPPITPIRLSHVCSRWRWVIVGNLSQWTNLEMNSTSRPEIFSDLLSRSKHRPFSLSISLPTLDIERGPDAKKVEFKETFAILKRNISRLCSLHIRSNNATFCLIFNKFLRNVFFPRLASLSLDQVDPTLRRFNVGPVQFDPAVFQVLRLENIMIDCDASCLAGLLSLHLVNSAGTLLVQKQLTHSTYPVIPETPAMPHLSELKVECTHLVPIHTQNMPSFRRTSLRRLILSRIRMPTMTDDALDRIHNLLHITYCPLLEDLVIDSLDNPSFKCFVRRLVSDNPKYQSVRRLSLVNVDLSLVDYHFMWAFPSVTQLNLIAVNPHPILAFLRDPKFMPMLSFINIDYKVHYRVISSRAVTPSASGPAPA